MTFDIYLTLKLITAAFGTLVLFPLCLWWLKKRDKKRNNQSED